MIIVTFNRRLTYVVCDTPWSSVVVVVVIVVVIVITVAAAAAVVVIIVRALHTTEDLHMLFVILHDLL